mmetsp:Transcript_59196/g.135797  ORF Transcript_59196/g.135797 Transcript_59196/m.135797 type:complete len:237 (-) Transcript_59196:191-901(-)
MALSPLLSAVLGWTAPSPQAVRSALPPRSRVCAAIDFFSADWGALRSQLDALSVFAVVNGRGMPVRPTTYFADVEAAESACAAMRASCGSDLDITPVGLGIAFQAVADGRCDLVAREEDVRAATERLEAASTSFPMDHLFFPMFTCAELASESPSGRPTLPIFMSAEDANEAMGDAAVDAEMECLSLQGVVEQSISSLQAADGAPEYRFVAPSASVAAIRTVSDAALLSEMDGDMR